MPSESGANTNLMKIVNKQEGYTIIELLAVISILVVMSGIIVSILYSTLRGSSKTKITSEVTQNGSYVLSVVNKTINDSRSVTMIGALNVGDVINTNDVQDCKNKLTSTNSITLKRLDGTKTRFACGNVGVDGSNIYAITINTDPSGVGAERPLINANSVAVEENSCSFTCDQSSGDLYAYPIVGVKFKLKDKGATVAESQGSQVFQTSVSLNNYLP